MVEAEGIKVFVLLKTRRLVIMTQGFVTLLMKEQKLTWPNMVSRVIFHQKRNNSCQRKGFQEINI